MHESARRLVDAGVASALVGLAQLEVWTSPAMSAGDAVIAAVATSPLAARRVAPVPVLAICVAALLLLTLQRSDDFTVAQLLALMLATYTVANRRAGRWGVVALVAVTAAGVANSAAAGSSELGDYVFPVILLGVPWAAGAALRHWQGRAAELRRLSDELRVERELVARLAVTAERGRIARDLHDSLAQSLNAMVVHAEAAEAAMDSDPSRVAASLARIGQVGRQSLRETRELLTTLRADGDLDRLRLTDLPRLVRDLEVEGLHVTLEVDGSEEMVTRAVQAAVVRVVQESLSNVVKHSTAQAAVVRVCLADSVHVSVVDDGDAVDGERGGLGIVGMRERAALLGGELRAGPRAGGGFEVRATLPARSGG